MASNVIIKKVTGFISLLLMLALTISAFQCDNEKGPEFVFMILTLPITVSQPTGEISIGDTIWINANVPDTLLEYYTNQYFKLKDFDFKMSLGIKELTNPNLYFGEQPGAIESFQIANKIGSVSNLSGTFGDFQFHYENEKYNCKIGLVPTSSGIYTISFLWPIDLHGMPSEQIDLRPVINLEESSDGRKRIPVYDGFFFVINEGETNFDLFTQNCRAGSLENPQSYKDVYYEQKCSFTFRVVK